MKKIGFNTHVSIYATLTGCDPKLLEDENFILSTLISSIIQGRMKLIKLFYKKFEDGGKGITIVALIADSHIIVNTFPENYSLLLDIYSCTGYPINSIYEFIKMFKPKKFEITFLPRNLKDDVFQSRIILSENDIDKELNEWMKKRDLLPLINTNEKFLILVNLIGFIIANGYLHNGLKCFHIYHKNKYILEILKKKINLLKVNAIIKPKINKKGNKIFELYVNDKNLCKLLYILGAPKDSENNRILEFPSWLKNEEEQIKAIFLSPLLLKAFDNVKGIYNFENEKNDSHDIVLLIKSPLNENSKDFIKNIEKTLNEIFIKTNGIVIKKLGKKKCYGIRIKLTYDNFIRMQIITSINKIFPLSLFEINISMKQKSMYQFNTEYYKIINFLLKNKKISVSSIFNDFEFPYNEGLRILRLLKKHNIVKVEDKRIVCLNLDESE
ncbi:MAG: S-adenosylmethionine decarboxylase [Nitrososphaerota archaeon]